MPHSPVDTAPEDAVLGMALNSRATLASALDTLSESDFIDPRNQEVFRALANIEREGLDVDLATVAIRLPPTLRSYAVELVEKAPLSQNPEPHLKAVKAQRWARDTSAHLRNATQILTRLTPYEPVTCTLDRLTSELEPVIAGPDASRAVADDIAAIADRFSSEFDAKVHERRSGKTAGVPTGLPVFDKVLTGGWRRGRLIVIGARPGQGKTQFAIYSALHGAMAGHKVGFISLEMKAEDIFGRMLANRCRIDSAAIDSADVSESQVDAIHEAREILARLPLLVSQPPATLSSVERELGRMARWGAEAVFVDFLQMLRSETRRTSTRADEIECGVTAMKNLALRHNIAVVALAQLNRSAAGDDSVSESQLKGSGALEERADTVILLVPKKISGLVHGEVAIDVLFRKVRYFAQRDVVLRANLSISNFWEDKK